MTEGVPLHQLRCPTCGALYEDFNMHSDPEEFEFFHACSDITAVPSKPWYLLCPNGHKWTVKMLWRSVNYPDRVQLGEYVGSD